MHVCATGRTFISLACVQVHVCIRCVSVCSLASQGNNEFKGLARETSVCVTV